jgi:hypothetical protein
VIAQDLNVPLIVQPQLFGLFSLLSWGQCLYYRERRDAVAASRSRARCAVVLGCTLALWGALEAALVFAVRVRRVTSLSVSPPFFFVLFFFFFLVC